MRLKDIILDEGITYDPEYNKLVDKLKDRGGVYKGSGDYGSVYFLKGKAYKVTTDQDELDHAEVIEGKKTNNFVYIYEVKRVNDKLGIIVMEILSELDDPANEITDEYIEDLKKEAAKFGIDPEELDVRDSNFMKHPRTGKVKHIDV
mgnify:CR=1 FL=1